MSKLLLFCALCILTNCVLQIFSDPSTTTCQYPQYSQTILQKNYTVADPNPITNGANWIWTNATSLSATFQTLFYACMNMAGTADVSIKANNSYFAYLNGVSIRAGYKNQTDSTSITLLCGLNNLTIKVENTSPNATSSGLVFKIHQDQGFMPTCNSNGYYNYLTCGCQCSGNSLCFPTQMFVGYPTCGCKCSNQGTTVCDSNRQYFDQKSCSCKCKPAYCRKGFELDSATCSCRCVAKTCTSGNWNYNQCSCL